VVLCGLCTVCGVVWFFSVWCCVVCIQCVVCGLCTVCGVVWFCLVCGVVWFVYSVWGCVVCIQCVVLCGLYTVFKWLLVTGIYWN